MWMQLHSFREKKKKKKQDNVLLAISKTHNNFQGLIYTNVSDTLWMVLFQGLHTSILPILLHPKSIESQVKKAEYLALRGNYFVAH